MILGVEPLEHHIDDDLQGAEILRRTPGDFLEFIPQRAGFRRWRLAEGNRRSHGGNLSALGRAVEIALQDACQDQRDFVFVGGGAARRSCRRVWAGTSQSWSQASTLRGAYDESRDLMALRAAVRRGIEIARACDSPGTSPSTASVAGGGE